MAEKSRLSYIAGAAWIIGILMIGVYLPHLTPIEQQKLIEQLKQTEGNLTNPELKMDRELSKPLIDIREGLEATNEWLIQLYDQLPQFDEPETPHLTQKNLDDYQKAYRAYVSEIKKVRAIMGEHPGLFRVIAFYAMAGNLHIVNKNRALVEAGISEEEFDWIRDRLMETAIYSALYTIEHEQFRNQEQREHLDWLLNHAAEIVGAAERDEEGIPVFVSEKFDRRAVPQSNLRLFLDNYQEINFQNVHFTKPTWIELDREGILKSAAGNPE